MEKIKTKIDRIQEQLDTLTYLVVTRLFKCIPVETSNECRKYCKILKTDVIKSTPCINCKECPIYQNKQIVDRIEKSIKTRTRHE